MTLLASSHPTCLVANPFNLASLIWAVHSPATSSSSWSTSSPRQPAFHPPSLLPPTPSKTLSSPRPSPVRSSPRRTAASTEAAFARSAATGIISPTCCACSSARSLSSCSSSLLPRSCRVCRCGRGGWHLARVDASNMSEGTFARDDYSLVSFVLGLCTVIWHLYTWSGYSHRVTLKRIKIIRLICDVVLVIFLQLI